MQSVVLGATLVGGVCLVANLFVDQPTLSYAGLALLGVAVAVVGARLVRAPWLGVVCAAGSLGLAWSVLVVLRGAVPARELDAVLGGVATLCVAVALLRGPSTGAAAQTPAAPRALPGNHRS